LSDLAGMNSNGHYALGANLDVFGGSMAPVSGSFSGVFDGLGHTVSNLNISGGDQTGLFSTLYYGGQARNVGLEGVVVSGAGNVGALAGYNYGTISNSYATGPASGNMVTGSYRVGGLVGNNRGGGHISNSYATGSIHGSSSWVGGLAGMSYGSIDNSYATGAVSGSNNVGGLVGDNYYGSVLSNSYATGAVSGGNAGGLFGANYGTVTNSHYNIDTFGSIGRGGIYNAQFQDWLSHGKTLDIARYYSADGAGNYQIGNVQGLIDLLGFADSNNAAYKFVLTANIDKNLLPTGYTIPLFAAPQLDGAGHTLDGFTLSAYGQYVGFIGTLASGSTVTNLGLTNVSVTGLSSWAVGGLVGHNLGAVSNSYVTGAVSGNSAGGLVGNNEGSVSDSYAQATVSGGGALGGLVAINQNAGTVTNSHYDIDAFGSTGIGGIYNAQFQDWFSHGKVLDITSYYTADGAGNYQIGNIQGLKDLLGFADSTNATYKFVLTANIDLATLPTGYTIPLFAAPQLDGAGHTLDNFTLSNPSGSYVGFIGTLANGSTVTNLGMTNVSVTGSSRVGGLVGTNFGTVSNSYVTGGVSGSSLVGGLLGENHGTVNNSYATGTVSGNGQFGGLAGANYGAVNNSYADVAMSGNGYYIGGLVGYNIGTVSGSYALGTVLFDSNGNYVGGLVGYNGGSVRDSYASGMVSGGAGIGGLVGMSYGRVSNSYATGAVAGSLDIGGLIGGGNASLVSNSFWNTETSGQGTSVGGVGLTSAEMQQSANFTGWDLAGTWVVYDGHSNPLLRSFMKALTVTVSDTAKTYDGQVYSGTAPNVTYSVMADSNLLGSFVLGGSAGGAINAGSYTNAGSGLYSTSQQGGYSITYVDGTLTIDKKTLTITGSSAASKTYDGNTSASVTAGSLSGFVGGETVAVGSSSGSFDTKDAGIGKTVTASHTLADGSNGGLAANYTLANETLSADISAKALTITGSSAANKTYDGNTTATVSAGSLSGFVGGETVAVGSSNGSFDTKNVGTGKTVTASHTLADGDNGGLAANYVLANETLTANITPAHLTVTADDQTRLYGQANPTFTETISGYVHGENATSAGVSGTANGSSTANATTGAGIATISASAGTLAASNYDFSHLVDGKLTINALPVAPTAGNEKFTTALVVAQSLPPIVLPAVNTGVANAGTATQGGASSASADGADNNGGRRLDGVAQLVNAPLFAQPLALQIVNGGMRLPAGLSEGE